MRIAVLSDLHIGAKARGLDLCPHDIDRVERVSFVEDYLGSFLSFVCDETFRRHGPIDYICVTGDISDRASPIEFERADEVLGKIARALDVRRERIYFVPGNHDVHWPVAKLAPTTFWKAYRFEPLLQPGLLFGEQLQKASEGKYDDAPHFVAWHSPDLLVLGINTAAYDQPEPEDGEHHGLVHPQTVSAIDEYVATLPLDTRVSRLCLLHHHPINYSDPRPAVADFSTLTNAGQLVDVLAKHRFDLILHGHKHVPHLQRWIASHTNHPMTVLGAGSWSAQLDTNVVGTVTNQFHVIDIEGRNASTGALCGYVSTWVYDVSGKWKEGHTIKGLCAAEAFGLLDTPTELENEIAKHVDAVIQRIGACSWPDLVDASPNLRHANTRHAYEALKAVAAGRSLRFLGDLDSRREDWTLLPQRRCR